MNPAAPLLSPLDRARRKAYWRLLPLVFFCYVVAYIDRANVSVAKLTMADSYPAFNDAVIGIGAGIFYLGYILLEIPGALIVQRWGARLWIARIMITWGLMAALTAAVTTPNQFYTVRFLLGLAEAGFFPGVVVYLTQWFPSRDRARTLAYLIMAQPVAQLLSLPITGWLIKFGMTEKVGGQTVHHATLFGLQGWQVVYIFWGLPAVLLGAVVWFLLTDRPAHAGWLTSDEKAALADALANDQGRTARRNMPLIEAFKSPKVLLLTAAYFCGVSVSLGLELFMPSIMKDWYKLEVSKVTWLAMLPPALALVGVWFIGWNSDRVKERRWHALVPVILSLIALAIMPFTQGGSSYVPTLICFMVAGAGLKAYQPAFWSLPSLFLAEAAAAGSIGLINCVGNIGAFYGQAMLGNVKEYTGSYVNGLYVLCGSLVIFITIIFFLGLGRKEAKP